MDLTGSIRSGHHGMQRAGYTHRHAIATARAALATAACDNLARHHHPSPVLQRDIALRWIATQQSNLNSVSHLKTQIKQIILQETIHKPTPQGTIDEFGRKVVDLLQHLPARLQPAWLRDRRLHRHLLDIKTRTGTASNFSQATRTGTASEFSNAT